MTIEADSELSPGDAAFIAECAAHDAATVPPVIDPATGAPPVPVDFGGEAAELVGLICDSAEAIFADTGLEFSPATRAKLAAAWSPLLEKYGLTAGGLFGAYSAEIGAAIVTVPVILAARKVIQTARRVIGRAMASAAAAAGSVVEPLPPVGVF